MKRLIVTLASVSLLLLVMSCGGEGTKGPAAGEEQGAADDTARPAPGGERVSRLDEEIDRLERQAERNPADEETRDQLSAAYVRRGDAHRSSQQLKEALSDYRRALRVNPDNEEAMKNSAELSPVVEGTPPPGEFGEPAPLPIGPDATGDGAESPTPEKP